MKKLIGVIVFLAVLSIVIYLVTKDSFGKTGLPSDDPAEARPPKLQIVKSELWNSAN